jgi:transposase-like protein
LWLLFSGQQRQQQRRMALLRTASTTAAAAARFLGFINTYHVSRKGKHCRHYRHSLSAVHGLSLIV